MSSLPVLSADMYTATGMIPKEDTKRRGLNVYTLSDVQGLVGRDRNGNMISGTQEVPLFGLSIIDRIMISQKCDAVFGVITGRMNRIAGLEWSVVRESKMEDRIELWLKQCKQLFDEYASASEIKYQVIRAKMVQNIMTKLPDVLPDLSNFGQSLLRWKKRIEQHNDDATTEIEDWMHQPNAQDNFGDFTKKWVYDWLVHGGAGQYKEFVDGKLQNIYQLPGGTVVPLKNRYVSAMRAFAQIIPGMDPKIYFSDEINWSTYMPTSGISYGMIPLEALVNKIAETLFFDQRAAEMADGTRAPEKLAVFGGEKFAFGGLNDNEAPEIPLSSAEQSRLETLLNEPRKNAMRVLTGHGTPVIVDLSRADTFQYQAQRQQDIWKAVALVYNATNMEINLTGGDDTSGRSTSEAQANIEKEKGIWPMVKGLEDGWNFNLLPPRFGSGYLFQYKSGLSDKEQAELEQAQMATQTWTPNEIRLARGAEPMGPEYDKLPGGDGQPQMTPDGSSSRPFNMRAM